MIGTHMFGARVLNIIPNAPLVSFCAVFPRDESEFGDLSNRACACAPLPPRDILTTNPLTAHFFYNMAASPEFLSSLMSWYPQ